MEKTTLSSELAKKLEKVLDLPFDNPQRAKKLEALIHKAELEAEERK